jgi:hypothetical protein
LISAYAGLGRAFSIEADDAAMDDVLREIAVAVVAVGAAGVFALMGLAGHHR